MEKSREQKPYSWCRDCKIVLWPLITTSYQCANCYLPWPLRKPEPATMCHLWAEPVPVEVETDFTCYEVFDCSEGYPLGL